jgi:hypothetical protein
MSSKKQMSKQTPFCKVCFDAGKSEKEYSSHYVRSAPGPEGKVVCPTLLCQSCGYCGDCGHTPKFCPVLAAEKAAEEKAIKQAARREALEKREAEKKVAPKVVPVIKKTGFAAAFGSDSDSETEQKVSKQVKSKKIVAPMPKPVSAVSVAVRPSPAKKIDEFPALNAPIQPAKSAKSAASNQKPAFMSAINKIYPELVVAATTPKIETYKPPMAQLVRNKPQEAAEEYHAPSPSEFTMADFIEASIPAPPSKASGPLKYTKASEMNWAMEASDSDSDEDW